MRTFRLLFIVVTGALFLTSCLTVEKKEYKYEFTGKNTGYLAGANGLIKKTTNGGSSWNVSPSSTSEELRAIYFVNADTGYAVGGNGTILKTNNGGVISGVDMKPTEPVFMIYPNPAHDKIHIIPGNRTYAGCRLTITNMLGEQEATKECHDQSAYEFDVTSIHEGLHVLKIQTEHGVEYKKFGRVNLIR